MSALPIKSIDKSKNHFPAESLSPDYLNFIRRNHVKFEMEERLGAKIIQNSPTKIYPNAFDDKNQFYQLNSQKRLSPVLYREMDQREVSRHKHESDVSVGEIQKNYKTLDIAPHVANHHKYQNYGQSTIVARDSSSKEHNHLATEKSSHRKQHSNQSIKQTLLQNEEFIRLLQLKNKQIAQKLRNPQQKVHKHVQQHINPQQKGKHHKNNETKEKHMYRSQTPSGNYPTESHQQLHNKAVSEFKIIKPHSNKESNLLLNNKKHNMRDLWKEKFINANEDQKGHKRYEKKKPQSELKFPHINGVPSQREDVKTNLSKNYHNDMHQTINQSPSVQYEELLELNECALIKNSKPRPSKNHEISREKQLISQNHSLQLLGSQNIVSPSVDHRKSNKLQEVRRQKLNMINEWEAGLIGRNESVEAYHKRGNVKEDKYEEHSDSQLHQKNDESVMLVIKRRGKMAQRMTNFLVSVEPQSKSQLKSSTEIRKSKNYKEMARQKQKQFQSYLIENSILKSTKIVNYYEKQEIKKKNLFEEMQKNYCGLLAKHSENQKEVKREEKAARKVIAIESQNNDNANEVEKHSEMKQSTYETEQLLEAQQQISSLIERSPIKKKGPTINSIKKDYDLSIYEIKIRSYREFLFMVNLAHKLFININLKPASEAKSEAKFTYFIGKGNNRLLIKSLMNRRFWWEETKDQFKANFVWTQLKVNELYQHEPITQYPQNYFDKLEENQEQEPNSPKKKKQQKGPQKAACYKPPLPEVAQTKILTKKDLQSYNNIIENISQTPQSSLNFSNRSKFLPPEAFNTSFTQETLHKQKVHNHLQFNYFIGNKKALFYNMHNYYKLIGKNAFEVIPYTLHIKKGVQDAAYNIFLKEYKKIAKEQATTGLKNIWIVKPGELSNRGQGITVIDEVYELNNILKKKEKHNNGTEKSYILQKYIQKPLLYKNRKFDIRHYVLLTRFHGRFRAYFYGQGYIRTSSHQFKLDQLDQMIHLTNDAIQKHGDSYGKHQDGNKVSYTEFQRYLDSVYGEGKHNFAEQIYPRMKGIALDAVKATYGQLDPKRLEHNFELLGLDFMIDSKFNVWLIEVNTNPCLELSSKLLQRIIPQMAENTLRICIDPVFPPPTHYPNSLKHMCPDNPLQRLQYELIFDEARDGKQVEEQFAKCNLKQLYKDMGEVDEEDATFENDGKEIQFKNQKTTDDNQ